MNTANRLTMLRIAMIPIFLIFVMLPIPNGYLIAAAIFLAATITDILDGAIARRSGSVSIFGKVFDPIADKALVLSALIPLVVAGDIGIIAVIIILAREILVSGLRVVVSSGGGKVIAASWLGKIKTVSQDVVIIIILIKQLWLPVIGFRIDIILMGFALVFTVLSALDYFWKNQNIFSH